MNWLRKTARRTNRRCQRQKNAGAWFRFQDVRYSDIQSLTKNPDDLNTSYGERDVCDHTKTLLRAGTVLARLLWVELALDADLTAETARLAATVQGLRGQTK